MRLADSGQMNLVSGFTQLNERRAHWFCGRVEFAIARQLDNLLSQRSHSKKTVATLHLVRNLEQHRPSVRTGILARPLELCSLTPGYR